MLHTNMGWTTGLLGMREDARNEVPPGSEMVPDAGNGAPSVLLALHPPIHLVVFTKRIFGADVVSSEDETLQDRTLRTVTVPLRGQWFEGRIRTIQIVVIDLDHLTEEIRLDGHTIGFISRAGHVFVAQTGTRLDRAEECGQFLSWDKAVTFLVTILRRLPASEESDPRVGAGEHTTGHHDGVTGQKTETSTPSRAGNVTVRRPEMVRPFFGPSGPPCRVCTTTDARGTCGTPTGENILLQPLSASQWLVIDRRVHENDVCSLLGSSEEKNQQFEMMKVRHGFQFFTFPSLAEALNHFSEPADGTASRELEFSSSLPPTRSTRALVVSE